MGRAVRVAVVAAVLLATSSGAAVAVPDGTTDGAPAVAWTRPTVERRTPPPDDAPASTAGLLAATTCPVGHVGGQSMDDGADPTLLDVRRASTSVVCPNREVRFTVQFAAPVSSATFGYLDIPIDVDTRTRTGCGGADRVVTVEHDELGYFAQVFDVPSCDGSRWGLIAEVPVSVDGPTINILPGPSSPSEAFAWFAIAGAADGTEDASSDYWYTFDGFELDRPRPQPAPPVPPSGSSGYWMFGETGRVHEFGAAPFYGEPHRSQSGNAPMVDLAPFADGDGYRTTDMFGNVEQFRTDGTRPSGSAPALRADEVVTSMANTPSGDGYWLFTSQGRVLPYLGAPFFGDLSTVVLNGSIVESVVTPTGLGYYMVGEDGGIFSFGDAVFYGSMGGVRLNEPVVALAPDPDGVGYWLVAADGGIFAFEASFRGSMGAVPLNDEVVGMVAFGNGYMMVAFDGGIFNFSDRPFHGSLGADPPPYRIISVAPLSVP